MWSFSWSRPCPRLMPRAGCVRVSWERAHVLPVRQCICGRTSASSLCGLMSTVLFCSLWVQLFIPPRLFLPAKQMRTCFQIKMSTAIFERAAPQPTSPSQMHFGVLQSSLTRWFSFFFFLLPPPTTLSNNQQPLGIIRLSWDTQLNIPPRWDCESSDCAGKESGTGPDLCWVQTHHIRVCFSCNNNNAFGPFFFNLAWRSILKSSYLNYFLAGWSTAWPMSVSKGHRGGSFISDRNRKRVNSGGGSDDAALWAVLSELEEVSPLKGRVLHKISFKDVKRDL